ncbi:hypothetical protein MMC16_001759 [Acarospora aff. strigata]|nr:hypothetical protein [Acarospora aff. strigata]
MAFWPFGRKSKRASTTTNATSGANAEEKVLEATSRDLGLSMGEGRRPGRGDSQRRKRDAANKLSKAQRTVATDPEKIPPTHPRAIPARSATGADGGHYANEKSCLPSDVARRNLNLTSVRPERGDIPSYYFQNPTSQSSLQPEIFTALKRPPTLRAKRSAGDSNLPRRKSSRRKAEDHAREQEIKALSAGTPVPKRPAFQDPGPLRRDTKKIHNNMNRHLERPTSDISLPLPESMHSSMSGVSEQRGFKVRSFDVLAPRPTIRCSDGRYTTGSGSQGPSRGSTRRDKRPVIPDEVIKQRKRIDDLADDMDATGLRELMERDRRRKEQKRQSDREKLQRKLQRKADKQKEEVGVDVEGGGNTSHKNLERGVLGREEMELDIDQPPIPRTKGAIPSSPNREDARTSPESWLQDPSKEHLPPENPFADPALEGHVPRTEEPTPAEELEEPVLGTANIVRLSQASMSPPTSPREYARGPSNLSAMTDLARQQTSQLPGRSDPGRRSSDTSGRAAGSWTSFFRRGGARGKRHSADRGRVTPSEFSNTSRESFARQPPPVAFSRNVRTRSGAPVRTQSKFREDLPELPISPPDSRVQSPEALIHRRSPYPDRAVSPLAETSSLIPNSNIADLPLEDIHPAFRQEVAKYRQQSPSPENDGDNGPSSALLSQSLASVDSEGSWLSGRPPTNIKRTSQPPTQQQRGSITSLQKRLDEFSNDNSDDDDDLALAEDEYFNRIHPGRAEHQHRESEFAVVDFSDPNALRPGIGIGIGHGHRKASSTAMANDPDDSDNDRDRDRDAPPLPAALGVAKDEGTWHITPARHPTIVRPTGPGPRVKSREGLLNDFLHSQSSRDPLTSSSPPLLDSPTSPLSDADEDEQDDNESPTFTVASGEVDGGDVRRATSVDLGRRAGMRISTGKAHVRLISAGSAKLLDLPSRTPGGTDGKRLSGGSGSGTGIASGAGAGAGARGSYASSAAGVGAAESAGMGGPSTTTTTAATETGVKTQSQSQSQT